jgi:hypothetical protein
MKQLNKSSGVRTQAGRTTRGFSPGLEPAIRLRKSLETRLRNLTNKKAAHRYLNAAEEKMLRLLRDFHERNKRAT